MSVFEDLIEELKEENLLEETVIDVSRTNRKAPPLDLPAPGLLQNSIDLTADDTSDEDAINKAAAADVGSPTHVDAAAPLDDREFYRRRAMEEVSSLQMVEHVLSGIEREHMKMTPASYDDLEVKKALHKYLQVSSAINSPEHSEAEFALMQETEKWFSALSKRDFNISVANLRRFCENSRPVLSSQALMALGRFYRNSPYAEPVRGKFDFVMTRLFSREIEDEKRKLLFPRNEMIGHVKTFYSNWSSLSLHAPGENLEAVSELVARFESFTKEAEVAETFDALVAVDFFNRIRLYKEETNESFFEGEVVCAAMECNVRIGNRFVDLILKEREAADCQWIEEKYGYSHDTVISNAASKTLLLLDLLKDKHELEEEEELESESVAPVERVLVFERAPVVESQRRYLSLFGVNRWLVFATLVVLAVSVGIYFWSENASRTENSIEVAPPVQLAGTELKTHIREASESNETLYAVTQPTWDALSKDEQKEFLRKAMDFASARGMKRVNLLNNRGRTVGFASATRLEVFDSP